MMIRAPATPAWAGAEPITGDAIMAEAARRHIPFPWVYEEQTMVLTDCQGRREVRRLKQYTVTHAHGSQNRMLVFHHPPELRGVALTATCLPGEPVKTRVFLPALETAPALSQTRHHRFLGTDFSLAELLPGTVSAKFRYTRLADQVLDKVLCYVIRAVPLDPDAGVSRKEIFIRQDIFFRVRTDYFDRTGRLARQWTRHDLAPSHWEAWHAGMELMKSRQDCHQTLIKTDFRALSRDYIPLDRFNRFPPEGRSSQTAPTKGGP